MEILISKEYKISTDPLNWKLSKINEDVPEALRGTVYKKANDEEGERGWKVIGYYPKIDWLYEDLIELKVHSLIDASKMKSLKSLSIELIKQIKEFKAEIKAELPKLKEFI